MGASAIQQNGQETWSPGGAGFRRDPRVPESITTSVDVPPGDYRLRVAAVDAEDRIGVLEIPFTAGYQRADTTVLSDLIVGVATGGQLEPRRRIERSEELTVMLKSAPVRTVPGERWS